MVNIHATRLGRVRQSPDDAWRWANGIYREPMPDVMWLTEEEWRTVIRPTVERSQE